MEIPFLRRCRPETKPRIRWWKLNAQTARQLRDAIFSEGQPDPSDEVDYVWNKLAHTIVNCAQLILGATKEGRMGDKAAWFWNEEVQKSVKAKKSSYKIWQKTKRNEDFAEYKKRKREAKAAVAHSKCQEMDSLYEKLDGPDADKHGFRLARARHRATTDIAGVKCVKDEDGTTFFNPGSVRERWRTYFMTLYNKEFASQPREARPPIAGPILKWTVEEVTTTLKKLKKGKAVGPENIPYGKC
ncbi:hypothetical protein Y032_0131g1619 [Ancylostoma ceylanicum]|uniref:Reverse transcriptase domain-containing protein n=1 Tax=Ancylostoma ceylanicum TaxID=53326 RepID=A0A016T611_9BILA|nr:hypothetical protein Y032_0131g1619 [Ancylostoma ceylanicum]